MLKKETTKGKSSSKEKQGEPQLKGKSSKSQAKNKTVTGEQLPKEEKLPQISDKLPETNSERTK